MRKILFLFCIFIILFSVSCEYDANDVKEPEFVKKLVVHCYISPSDSIIVARISYNRPAFGEISTDNPDISGVEAFLSNGQKEAQFTLHGDSFIIAPQAMPIIEDSTYYLKVTDNMGNTITSKCTIPVFREVNLLVDTLTFWEYSNYGNSKKIRFKITLSDTASELNNYRIVSYFHSYHRDYYDTTITINDYSFVYDNVFNDKLANGSLIKYSFETYPYYFLHIDSVFFATQVMQINSDYYSFVKSIGNYNEEDSYFSEYSPIYSNISGGLGIFGGYSKKVYSIKLDNNMVK